MSEKVDVDLNRCGVEPRGPARRRSCMTDSTLGLPGYPLDEFGLIRRGAAKTAAFSDNELCAAVDRGRLIRLVPGVLVPRTTQFDGHAGAQALHRLTSIAVVTSELSGDTPHVLSHVSAATMHGLRMLKPNLSHVHMTTGRRSGGSVRSLRHLHGAPLSDDEVTEVDGIRVTSIERTAVDVASSGDFAQALTVLEAALALGADRAKMSEILGSRRRRGAQHARRALPLANGLSQSVGESWSSAQMYEADLPVPRQQHRFVCPSGTYETDFDWDGKLIGEFDGLAKYGRLLREGESPEDAVVREKLREDELRGLDTMVVRWIWATLERRLLADLLRPWLVTYEIIPPHHGSRSPAYFPLIDFNKREGNG